MNLMAADLYSETPEPFLNHDNLLSFRKKRVLMVEEDWDFSQLLAGLLIRHLDIEVEVVKNPYQALSRMVHEPFDVLVLDSKWNPYQALLEAEQFLEPLIEEHLTEFAKVPVVVLTSDPGFSMQGLESHYFKIVSTVQKQFEIEGTVQKVESELNDILDL
jgi:DNA-binding NtrC family response regulator